MREILFVAGETSGDQHAAGVAREIRASGAPFTLAGIGGDRMREAGVELLEHVQKLAVMGFIEPLKHARRFLRLRRELRRRIDTGRVALVVLVDFAGFNMKVAAFAVDAGVPVLYYITPQVWASRASRLRELSRVITRAAVILPFEEPLLRAHGIDATFVGHPLLDRALALPGREEARAAIGVGARERLLVLFPGSRIQEISRHLDVFVETARELQRRNPALKVVVSAAPNIAIPEDRCPFPLVRSASLSLLCAADAAMCKSGTTTLEAAVALCPMVVAYRTDRVTYALAKRLVKIPFIGLVNVLAGREVAREFVQEALHPIDVADALEPLLDPASAARADMIVELSKIRDSLGEVGAAKRVAAMAIEMATASARRTS